MHRANETGAEVRELFRLGGQGADGAPLKWSVCGLPILLLNGFRREVIDGEDTVAVDNLDGLWTAVGLYLARRKKQLTGKEARFLRRHMDLTQAELGHLLRVSDQTVARWEKDEIPCRGPADFALRTAYLLMKGDPHPGGVGDESSWLRVMKDLADTDDCKSNDLTIRFGEGGWEEPNPKAA